MAESAITATSEVEWAAFVAIDWADQKNFWRLAPAGSGRQESGELLNTPEAVEAWAADLQQRFGGRPVAVCLEQSRGRLVYMLTKYSHLVCCSPYIRLRRHATGKPSALREPATIPAIRRLCWICYCAIANNYANSNRTPGKPGCCISW